jgi:hypothetical protein
MNAMSHLIDRQERFGQCNRAMIHHPPFSASSSIVNSKCFMMRYGIISVSSLFNYLTKMRCARETGEATVAADAPFKNRKVS